MQLSNLSSSLSFFFARFQRLSGGEFVGFNNSVFLAEKEVADRNYALAYYMKENKCFPKGTNIKQCLDFWYQVMINGGWFFLSVYYEGCNYLPAERNLLHQEIFQSLQLQ